jgi:hypothetical protein
MEPNPPAGEENPVRRAIRTARRGFRRDTEELVRLLDEGMLFVAVAPDSAARATSEETDALTLQPNLVTTDTGLPLLPAFTDEERLGRFAAALQWAEKDELSYCSLSLRGALDVALQLIQGGHCEAMVLDPTDEHELLLQPREIDSLRQGQPVPLVGYVRELPMAEDEVVLVTELPSTDGPLTAALDRCLAAFPQIEGYRLQQTLNRERDLDPQPTLTLITSESTLTDEEDLQQRLREVFEGALPDPGYIDVVFESPRGKP